MSQVLSSFKLPLRRVLNASNKRFVSVSSKKNDTAVVANASKTEAPTEVKVVNKNWVSYGFDRRNKEQDRFWTHATFFTTISLCMTLGTLYFTYQPDLTYKDWAQREAFLEIRRREEKGLPLIDENLVDINKIQLPSDEELGDTEIII